MFPLDMNPLFEYLERCKGVEQGSINHPEGDVFIHSCQVLRRAFKETIDTDLILAAMLHDIGKFKNTLGHEKIAVEWLGNWVSVKTLWLIEHHRRIWYLILGDMKKRSKVLELTGHPWLPDLVLLARWDKMGRNPNQKPMYSRDNILEKLDKCTEEHFDNK